MAIDRERRRQIERLYHSARALSPAQLEEFLAKACEGDDELRRELESLLGNPGVGAAQAEPLERKVAEPASSFAIHFSKWRALNKFENLRCDSF